MKNILTLFKNVVNFFRSLWLLRSAHVSADERWFVRCCKVLFVCGRGFFADHISLRASALTFYTLIAVVPVLSLLLGISAGFGLRGNLENWLSSHFQEQQELLNFLLNFSNSMLSSAKGGIFTGINMLFLLWSALNLLNNIEISFNHIWQVRRNRPWVRKFTDYLSVMLIAPVFLIASSSIAVALQGHVAAAAAQLGIYSYIAPLVKIGFKALGLVLVWLMFTFLYAAMPCTKVRFAAALTAGIVAGTLFHLVQNFYIYSQVVVAKYNAIYGSFAAIPLFLLWTQTSWLILLFGAKLSFAVQNLARIDSQPLSALSPRQRRHLTLAVLHYVVKRFQRCQKPHTAADIARNLNISAQMTCEILADLLVCGIVSEVAAADNADCAFAPAMDIASISVGEALERLDTAGCADAAPIAEPPIAQTLSALAADSIAKARNIKIAEMP
jgi:membrane protein